ncbi:MAG: GNAT family N-acetyltransferase [Vulcanimicrobiaceae bacterium]
MSEGLVALEPADYATHVLPATYPLWGAGRTFARYAEDLLVDARRPSGPRLFGFLLGDEIVASCKRYERTVSACGERLRTCGIGAVFTVPHARGRGVAGAMLAALLVRERASVTDLGLLFSDIGSALYEPLGFHALPSRYREFAASELGAPASDTRSVLAADRPEIERCDAEARTDSSWQLERAPDEWAALHAQRETAALALGGPDGRLAAYVAGRAAADGSDTFFVEEFAARTGAEGPARALLRVAAGTHARVRGWNAPAAFARLVPAAASIPRKRAILMVAPLSERGHASWSRDRSALCAAPCDLAVPCDHF